MNNYQLDDAALAHGHHGALLECPTCGLPAEITDRFTLGGAPEPVEHVKLVCVCRHWYTLPVDQLPTSSVTTETEDELSRPRSERGAFPHSPSG